MQITPIKTDKITYPALSITEILEKYLPALGENTVVAITSKILAISQGRLVKNDGKITKKELIRKEADYYLTEEPYPGIILTLKGGILIPSAGIDESNGNHYFILWPKNIQKTTNDIREYLSTKHNLKNIGIIITDSHTTPLRRGTTGIGLSHSGFVAVKNYIGTPDIFGKNLEVTTTSILDGLSSAAVVTMGEGNEQTPLAIITKVPFVQFQSRNPNHEELAMIKISRAEDIYAPLLRNVPWKRLRKKA